MIFRSSRVEFLTWLHVTGMGLLSTWFLGGGSSSARLALGILGSLAPLLAVAGLRERWKAGESVVRPLLPLVPWCGFNVVVLIGLLHPSLRIAAVEGTTVFLPISTPAGWPDSARPELALRELWLLNALVLTPYNLFINFRHRGTLRALFIVLASNALLLAIFGSFQRFSNAPGLYFGLIGSPNTTFFASFIYHNHWGSYVILALAVCLGLLFNLRPWSRSRDFWHSPALAAVVAVFFLGLTIPLSGARACTLLAAILIAAALLQGLQRTITYMRDRGRSIALPVSLIVVTLAAALGSTYLLASDVIDTRLADTNAQLRQMHALGGIGSRSTLYRDTWTMAADKPWFGWGLASYATIFRNFNTQVGSEGLPQFYEYAHSDWLQLLAETGVVGAGFYIAFLIMLLRPLRKWRGDNELSLYLLNGCGLIMLYACIEFPFGNPAVTLLFWTCLMGAVRWVRLNQTAPSC